MKLKLGPASVIHAKTMVFASKMGQQTLTASVKMATVERNVKISGVPVIHLLAKTGVFAPKDGQIRMDSSAIAHMNSVGRCATFQLRRG